MSWRCASLSSVSPSRYSPTSCWASSWSAPSSLWSGAQSGSPGTCWWTGEKSNTQNEDIIPDLSSEISSIRRGSKKTAKFKTYAKSLLTYLPCILIWTEKSLDIFFMLRPTYLFRKSGQIWKKVCTFNMAFRQIHICQISGLCQFVNLPFQPCHLWRGLVLGAKSECLSLMITLNVLTEVQMVIRRNLYPNILLSLITYYIE